MKYTVTNPETESKLGTVDCLESSGTVDWQINEKKFEGANVQLSPGQLEVCFQNGERFLFPVSSVGRDGAITVATALGSLRLLPTRGAALENGASGRVVHKALKSLMPGKVLKLLCKPGDTIAAGQPLLILEAMKMENEIKASHAGIIEEIVVQVGQKVETGELLAKIGQKND